MIDLLAGCSYYFVTVLAQRYRDMSYQRGHRPFAIGCTQLQCRQRLLEQVLDRAHAGDSAISNLSGKLERTRA